MQHTALLCLANDIGLFRDLEADRLAMGLGGLPTEALIMEPGYQGKEGRDGFDIHVRNRPHGILDSRSSICRPG